MYPVHVYQFHHPCTLYVCVFHQKAHEYADLPVRHNEDQVNTELAKQLPIEVNQYTMDSSHTKTHLLLQAHFNQTTLPSTDYLTDTKSVLDQAIRILQVFSSHVITISAVL